MSATTTSETKKGHLLAFTAVFIWGSTFISTKVLLRSFSPTGILLVRFLIGWLALWLIRPIRVHLTDRKEEIRLAFCGLTGICLNYLLENYALVYIQASEVSVIVSCAPFFTGVFSHFLSKKKLSISFLAGFAVALTGIAFISIPDGSVVELRAPGVICAVGVGVVWAIYSILEEKLAGSRTDPIVRTRKMFFYGWIFTCAASLPQGVSIDTAMLLQPVNLANFLYLGIAACACSFLLWNRGTEILGAVRVNLYFYIQPVITILLSVLILGERMGIRAWIGTVLALSGLILSERGI